MVIHVNQKSDPNNIKGSRILFNWMCKKPRGTHTHTHTKKKNLRDLVSFHIRPQLMQMHRCYSKCVCVSLNSTAALDQVESPVTNYFPDSWFSVITHNQLLGIWSQLRYSFTFLFCTSYLGNPVLHTFREGTWGEGGANTATSPQKKLTNTASPQEKLTKHRHQRTP